MFGVTASVCVLFIRFARCLLLRIFGCEGRAKRRMPLPHEILQYKEAISCKGKALKDFYAVADGLKLYLQLAGDSVIQNTC